MVQNNICESFFGKLVYCYFWKVLTKYNTFNTSKHVDYSGLYKSLNCLFNTFC